ncbi:MAG: hypothetical protein JWO36_4485 [Myxococcales bacterium]|nr:hypothetical protein [Myxococcales bacterium]
MRFIRTAILAAAVTVSAFACGNNAPPDADPFATMQLCFDEHHTTESLPVNDAIVICCLDHPINGVHPSCGNTVAECTARLEGTDPVGMLTQTADVTTAVIMAACQDYVTKKGQ